MGVKGKGGMPREQAKEGLMAAAQQSRQRRELKKLRDIIAQNDKAAEAAPSKMVPRKKSPVMELADWSTTSITEPIAKGGKRDFMLRDVSTLDNPLLIPKRSRPQKALRAATRKLVPKSEPIRPYVAPLDGDTVTQNLLSQCSQILEHLFADYLKAEDIGSMELARYKLVLAEELYLSCYASLRQQHIESLEDRLSPLDPISREADEVCHAIADAEEDLISFKKVGSTQDAMIFTGITYPGLKNPFRLFPFGFDSLKKEEIKKDIFLSFPILRNPSDNVPPSELSIEEQEILREIERNISLTKLLTEGAIGGIRVAGLELEVRVLKADDKPVALAVERPESSPELESLSSTLAELVDKEIPPGNEYYAERKDKNESAAQFLIRVYGQFLRAGLLYKYQLRKMDAKLTTAVKNMQDKNKDKPDLLATIPHLPNKREETDKRIEAISRADAAVGRVLASSYRRTK